MREIPLNAPLNGRELSEIRLVFERGQGEHASSPRGLMGLIAPSFLGTARHPGSPLGAPPFPRVWGFHRCVRA